LWNWGLKFLGSDSFFFFHCCAGWGHTVAFIKVLTIYQIHHIWVHPSTALLYPSSSHFEATSTGIIFPFA
jgi:protein tyrosine phosphatase